ncbi:LysR family transcriptional regulator [Marinobacter sp. F3R11]|uniref:LysR family transcriptional regulator n=1 Tax=Marinobacter sp. F3R11 TaxID=2267231 RepID=UPI000DE9E1D7|nr:LysR family transcriptional regulator [Marinobacter sp. F3R11]RBW48495.1 LysR family transcriptional regulator [Marinobacter sp. F3R11]
MNLKQLRAFREVMVTGSVSKAAENLFRTQPAISAQLAGLEKEVGLKLFERREGRLHPVPEAEYLLSQAVEILDKVDNLQENLTSVKNLNTGRINIVAMIGPSIFFLPNLISKFVKDRKHVDISLFSSSSFQTQQLMSAQRYDVGIVDEGTPDLDSGLSLVDHERLDYHCVCAVPANDPLARREFITARDLDGKPLAMLAETHGIHKEIKRVFEEQGLTMNCRFETQYFLPQLVFVERGLAYAIVDPITVDSYYSNYKSDDRIVFLPFHPSITFSISIITPSHRPLSTLANHFVMYLREELQSFQ